MTQRDLDLSIARATGESLPEIRRLGFGIADPIKVRFDPEPSHVPPQWLDWEPAPDVNPFRPARRRRKPVAA